MCLAAPARIISIDDNIATVDYGGVETKARLDTLTEDVAPGDYLLIHTGFAIRRLSAEDAEETLKLFDELAAAVAAGELGFVSRPDEKLELEPSQKRPRGGAVNQGGEALFEQFIEFRDWMLFDGEPVDQLGQVAGVGKPQRLGEGARWVQEFTAFHEYEGSAGTLPETGSDPGERFQR